MIVMHAMNCQADWAADQAARESKEDLERSDPGYV